MPLSGLVPSSLVVESTRSLRRPSLPRLTTLTRWPSKHRRGRRQRKGIPMKIAFDTGGTFTDLALLDDDGAVHTHKLLSTPHDPAEAVLNGIEHLVKTYRGRTPLVDSV